MFYLQTSVQVPAPAAGVIEALLVPDGGKVEGGTPLFKLRKTGGKLGPAMSVSYTVTAATMMGFAAKIKNPYLNAVTRLNCPNST